MNIERRLKAIFFALILGPSIATPIKINSFSNNFSDNGGFKFRRETRSQFFTQEKKRSAADNAKSFVPNHTFFTGEGKHEVTKTPSTKNKISGKIAQDGFTEAVIPNEIAPQPPPLPISIAAPLPPGNIAVDVR